ncbi:MAG TPA: DUF1292 domain-containing protein [Oscillospiraceae bacterium]|nr:DUF1292 domain-containing protein [Oscillospiraceae bacterium]
MEVINVSEDFGSDYITIQDDDGTEFELEIVDTMDYNGKFYTIFLPTDMAEDDPEYGYIILENIFEGDGEEVYNSVDDEDELQDVYEHFMTLLFGDEEETGGEDKEEK